MVRAPSPEEEDRRRLTRERGTLVKERIQHTNRIRGPLSGQGVRDYNPLRRDCFDRLEALRTGDGRQLPPMLKAEIRRAAWPKTGSRLGSKRSGERQMKSA